MASIINTPHDKIPKVNRKDIKKIEKKNGSFKIFLYISFEMAM